MCDRGVTNVMRLSFEIGKRSGDHIQKRERRMGPVEGGLTSRMVKPLPPVQSKKRSRFRCRKRDLVLSM
jgi:hypothetical protein